MNTTWELTLDKPYNKGGTATHPTNIRGLKSAVFVNGTINDPSDFDRGWNVVVAIPFQGLKRYGGQAPKKGDHWSVNFSRVEWKFKLVDGKYERVPKENSWTVFKVYDRFTRKTIGFGAAKAKSTCTYRKSGEFCSFEYNKCRSKMIGQGALGRLFSG